MMQLMNLDRTRSPNFGSGRISLLSARRRRDMLHAPRLFRFLRAVLRARLLAVLDALGVERAADDGVANAGQVLHAAAVDEHDRVFLQVVAFAGNVADDFLTGGQTDLGDLAE